METTEDPAMTAAEGHQGGDENVAQKSEAIKIPEIQPKKVNASVSSEHIGLKSK